MGLCRLPGSASSGGIQGTEREIIFFLGSSLEVQAATATAVVPTLMRSFQNAWESPADNNMECLELVRDWKPYHLPQPRLKAGQLPQNLWAQGSFRT